MFRAAGGERDVSSETSRQRDIADSRLEEVAPTRQRQRRSSAARRHARAHEAELRDGQRLRVIVVDVQMEHPGPWVHALNMMPVVRCHEKLSAMLRVVVPV